MYKYRLRVCRVSDDLSGMSLARGGEDRMSTRQDVCAHDVGEHGQGEDLGGLRFLGRIAHF